MIQQQLPIGDFSDQVQKNIWKTEAYFCASSFQLFWNLPKVKLNAHALEEISLSSCHFHHVILWLSGRALR